jgi:hypothetical protein
MRTPSLVGLLLAVTLPAVAGAQAAAPLRSTPAHTRAAAPAATAAAPAARPLPGRWVATVTDGTRGDAVHFTVSPDGAELRDVAFAGFWRCKTAGTIESLELARLGPPKPVPVQGGSFANVQTRAAWWWETNGRFTSATTAEGSYRQAAKNAGCDSRRLHWTARRIGD